MRPLEWLRHAEAAEAASETNGAEPGMEPRRRADLLQKAIASYGLVLANQNMAEVSHAYYRHGCLKLTTHDIVR